jgi:hypothetical protein
MFGRASLRKSTGKLIEFQSGDAPLGTLTQNAINAGIPKDDIEEKYITQAELDALMPKPPAPKNYKALYAAAATSDQKNAVIAEMLGLV